jgi:hypothetical protein
LDAKTGENDVKNMVQNGEKNAVTGKVVQKGAKKRKKACGIAILSAE